MGDGEIIGTAVEGANVTLTVDLVKYRETPWPRIENAEWIMSVGSGLSEMDAYEFVSQNARAPIVQMVDPQYTVLVKIPKNRLPAPTAPQRR